MRPWVSIVTPLYNGIEFLEECAMSVCLQDCSNKHTNFTWEWWIGINGHEDGGAVLAKAREVKAKCQGSIGDCEIHVINLPTARGKVAALNEMVPKCRGEWIAVLDCDDTWERDKLMYQKLTIEKSRRHIDVIGTHCRYFGEFVSDGPQLPSGYLQHWDMWRANPLINSSVLIRRELAVWEDRFVGLEDYDLWLRLREQDAVFFNVPKRLVNHRIHGKSAFNGQGRQDVAGLIEYHKIRHTIGGAKAFPLPKL